MTADSPVGRAGGLQVLKEPEAAKLLSVSYRTLQDWRYKGTGPAYVKLGGKRIGYQVAEIERFMKSQTSPTASSTPRGVPGGAAAALRAPQ